MDNAECRGIAFEFPESSDAGVREYLVKREGKGFPLEAVAIRLESGVEIAAYTPIYNGDNLVTVGKAEKILMIAQAWGASGRCRTYIRRIADLLSSLNIEDVRLSPRLRQTDKTQFAVR